MGDASGSLPPALELIGWLLLAACFGFLFAAQVSRRSLRKWRRAECELMVLEGQPCLVWSTADGTRRSTLHEHALTDTAAPSVVYYRIGHEQHPQTTAPVSHARMLGAIGWSLLGAWALSNIISVLLAM